MAYQMTFKRYELKYLLNRLHCFTNTVGRWNSFFKWVKQHLKIKSFWGTTESAVRIQIFSAITAYCMVAIVEHDLQLNRSNYEVLRILSASLLDKTPIKDLFTKEPVDVINDGQLSLNFFQWTLVIGIYKCKNIICRFIHHLKSRNKGLRLRIISG